MEGKYGSALAGTGADMVLSAVHLQLGYSWTGLIGAASPFLVRGQLKLSSVR